MRTGLAALAVLFLLAHLASLPPALEDLDSINFALGVRDFDVAQHQPHPPGYPLYVALGKIATPLARAAGIHAPEVRGLAAWSALAGALLLPLIYAFWRTLDGNRGRALAATLIAAACPLFWFTALRPLSDMVGLAGSIAALVLLARSLPPAWGFASRASPRLLIAGACVTGFVIGFRSQTAVLTAPLLALVVLAPRTGVPARIRIAAVIAAAFGVALWGIPLVIAAGGPSAYVRALGSQAGEDFSGVVMLYTNRTLRVAVFAVRNTFVLPWDSPVLAGVAIVLAAAGAVLVMLRAPRRLAILAIVFAPYAVFHLLFQETITVRYALPLVIPIAYLAAVTITEARAAVAAGVTAAIAAAGLWLAVPAGVAFGRVPSPVFAMLRDMHGDPAAAPVLGMHRRVFTESRRARQWSGPLPARVLPAPRDYEWLEVTRAWREGIADAAWFAADPRRTDLVLFDPESRLVTPYRWPFPKDAYVGGARPDEVDWHVYSHPGWFLEQGWALSPEVAGITERDGWGPHKRPSIGWIRRRPGETMLLIGGRHLGAAGDPPVRLVVSVDDCPVLTFDTPPGFFLRLQPVPAGALDGKGPFAKLTVRAEPVLGSPVPRVAIEQFDLQAPDRVVFGYDEGWFEPEYNPGTGRSWRWMAERADLLVHGGGRDVVVRIDGESPRRYYSGTTELRVAVAGQTVATLTPDADFTSEIRVPAALLAAGNGRVTLASSRTFVPGDREGTADRRQLGLRIYSIGVSAAR